MSYTDLPDDALAGPTVGLVCRMTVAARSEVDAASLAAPVRRVIAGVDPALARTRV